MAVYLSCRVHGVEYARDIVDRLMTLIGTQIHEGGLAQAHALGEAKRQGDQWAGWFETLETAET